MKKLFIKKVLPISIIALFFAQALYITVVEPTIAIASPGSATTGPGGTVVNLTVTSGVSITTPGTVTMSPLSSSVNTSTNMTNNPLVTWTVRTNDAGGYALKVKTGTTANALRTSGNTASFTDVSATPALWSTFFPPTGYKFGFSVYGGDVNLTTFPAPASGCGVGILPDTSLKYRGFDGTTDIQVASKTTVTPTAGVDTNICFAAEQNGVYAPSGAYTVTVIATAFTT